MAVDAVAAPILTVGGLVAAVGLVATLATVPADADNSRLNNGVVANVYTIQPPSGTPTTF